MDGKVSATSFFFFNYLFLVMLHLRYCVQAFSSCSEQWLLSSCGARTSHCSEGLLLLRSMDHRVSGLQQSWCTGLVAYGIFLDQASNLCIGRWILNHWTSREVLSCYFLILHQSISLKSSGMSPVVLLEITHPRCPLSSPGVDVSQPLPVSRVLSPGWRCPCLPSLLTDSHFHFNPTSCPWYSALLIALGQLSQTWSAVNMGALILLN